MSKAKLEYIIRFLISLLPAKLQHGKNEVDFNSANYWEKRYAAGKNSGAGSYNHLARFKAEILNNFVSEHSISSVIEFGCGDGNQLSLAKYPKYLGFDVSETAINICKNKFRSDTTKEFRLMNDSEESVAELTLSLDVIYHLVEDSVFESYMRKLFHASIKYVIIYSSNKEATRLASHVRHRNFTSWVEKNASEFKLSQFIKNRYLSKYGYRSNNTSLANFYIYKK